MRRLPFIELIAVAFVVGVTTQAVSAQAPPAPASPTLDKTVPLEQQYSCPPGVDPKNAPLLGESETSGSGGTLSEQLAESRGIVCPPNGVDSGIVERPPGGGTLRVIPPPDSDVVPK